LKIPSLFLFVFFKGRIRQKKKNVGAVPLDKIRFEIGPLILEASIFFLFLFNDHQQGESI